MATREAFTERGLRRLAAALACFAALASGCQSPPAASVPGDPAPAAAMLPSPPTVEVPYRIGPSDELAIHVLPDPTIDRMVVVQPDGSFAFDLIGAVSAAGRTPEDVAEEIEKRIGEFRANANVSVVIARAASSSVTLLGEVHAPGMYPIERSLRVTDVIARAGDVTELAAASRVRLIRRHGGEAATYLADLDRIREGEVSTDYVVQGGDIVYVPPAEPVRIGYALGRALYPLEVISRAILAPIAGVLMATD
jgi:polysaccharide export outer membrane protein